MKYYSFYTAYRSLKEDLSKHLKNSGIYYELAGEAGAWYFSILTDEAGASQINQFIESLSIWEVTA